MQRSDVPVKFTIPFANSAASPANKRQVPTASQIGIQGGAASLTDGFPPVTFQPLASGGVPPWGADFNGLLNQITAWTRWLSAGVPTSYDSVFQAAIGGYPLGSIVESATTSGRLWTSLVDNNVTNPDTFGVGWRIVAPYRSGEMFWWPFATPPAYAAACDGSAISRTGIGQGIWLQSSGGAPPCGPGNGTTTFTLPDMRGYFARGWDNGRGIDPSRTLGSFQADAFESHAHAVSTTQTSVDSGTAHARTADVGTTGTLNTGATGDTETRPMNVALQMCICY
jgi:microcystin-dependent protein